MQIPQSIEQIEHLIKTMISDGLVRFSIKQRLRSANHSSMQQSPTRSSDASHKKIHAPEHYNYFMHTIEKEIKHETHTFRKIKRKIDDYKSKKESRMKIKNAFEYSHQCFPSQVSRKKVIKSQKSFSKTGGEPFREMTNTESNFIYPFSSESKTQMNRIDRALLTSAQSSTSFIRSPQTTVYNYMQRFPEKEVAAFGGVSTPNRQRGKLRKEGIFELTGTKPKWTTFQSYRQCYNNASRTPL